MLSKTRDDVEKAYQNDAKIQKMIEAYERYMQFSERDAFVKGFKLAAKILIEVNNSD